MKKLARKLVRDRQLQVFTVKALADGMLKDIVKEAKNGTDADKKEAPSA